jgi:orotate phosphoribosyltransferase
MSTIIKDSNGQLVPTVFQLGTTQVFTVTNSSAASAAFGPFTTMVRVACSLGHAHIAFGVAPVASITTSPMMPTNWSEVFSVNPGDKIAVIKDAATTGSTISVTELI